MMHKHHEYVSDDSGSRGRRGRNRGMRGKVRGAIRLANAGLAAAAVTRELRLPRKQRTWHGQIIRIPYDFRTPSPARIKRSMWSPDDPRLVVPRAFGVGWTVNLGRLTHEIREQVTKSRAHSG